MELGRLEQQIKFILEIDKLKTIVRQNFIADGSRRENDSEHSWHMAMMAVTLSEYFEGADLLKTVKMVLIHDLVEIYAGDTFAYDEAAYRDKDEREQKAADKLFSMLPPDQEKEFRELWQEFERIDTKEAVFAATLDRMQPLLLNLSTEGKMWKIRKVTKDMVLKRNKLVLERAPEIVADYVRKRIEQAEESGWFCSKE